MTVILNSKEIKECVKLDKKLIPVIERTFKDLSQGKATMPPILRLDIEKYHGESDVKAAYIDGLDSYAIKIASGFFNNPDLGIPSSNGLMILLDSKTGVIKSVLLDKGYLTDVRTAIAGAIAAKYLSNPESASVGIIGAGIQAKMQLQSLMLVRKIKSAYVWSRNINKTQNFVNKIKIGMDLDIRVCETPQETVQLSEIIITTTPSKSPIIKADWLKKGLHITAMGSDAEQKNELDPHIIKECDVYVPDNQLQTSILGELNHAIKAGLINFESKYNDLGKVIIEPNLGRKSIDDITVADLTGTGVQDTAIARHTFAISQEKKLGVQIN